MESWRAVWRRGFAPQFTDSDLEVLREGLLDDDARLIQGATTTPPPLLCVQDWPIEAACFLGYIAWQSRGLDTVGEVEEFFARCCFNADETLGEPAACRWVLNWYDDTPRNEMRRGLIEEIDDELNRRRDADAEVNGSAEVDAENPLRCDR